MARTTVVVVAAALDPAGRQVLLLHRHRGDDLAGRVRPLAHQPRTAELSLYAGLGPPRHADVARWLGAIADHGYTAVRTGALDASSAAVFAGEGFTVVQTLVVLDLVAPRRRWRRSPTRSLDLGDVDAVLAAAQTDQRAFPGTWGLDAASLLDVARATPVCRARLVGEHGVHGVAIGGVDRGVGYLQRVSVDPEHQRRGLGSLLVADQLSWMGWRRCHRVLVNTQAGNRAALGLYGRFGFRLTPAQLVVLEREVAAR